MRFMSKAGLAIMLGAVSAVLSGCGGSSTSYTPAPLQAAGQQISGSPIAHIIVVTMENRTPDNLFCTAFPALVNPSLAGTPFPGMDLNCPGATSSAAWQSLASPIDPGHSYQQLVAEWDNGKLDGFALDPVYQFGSSTPVTIPGFATTYVPPNETIIYSTLAATYATADRMFSSGLTASFPGHQFIFAGQSGAADNPQTSVWGCDAPANALAPTFGPNNTAGPGAFPCYDYRTVGDLLDAKGVSWRYYTGTPGTQDGNIDAVGAIRHLRYGPDFGSHVVSPPDAISTDLQNCTLPSVAFVNAPALSSDHSGTLSAGGPGWVGQLYLQWLQTKYNTIPNCQYLNNSAIVLTWDDSGGWADHVVPPTDPQTGRPYGFRVPLIVISPYANHPSAAPVFVSHVPFTFGSIVRFIEDNFSLGSLGEQDAESADLNTGDLTGMFNYNQKPIPPIAGLLVQDFQRQVATSKTTIHTPPGTPVDDDK